MKISIKHRIKVISTFFMLMLLLALCVVFNIAFWTEPAVADELQFDFCNTGASCTTCTPTCNPQEGICLSECDCGWNVQCEHQ